MKRKKKLYCVSIPDNTSDSCYIVYALAFNECHALNMTIRNLHEQQGIPLEYIDYSSRLVFEVINFIK